MAKTIAFRGKEKSDFAYYIAKSLASNKFHVAVIDNSFSKDLFESIHQYNDDDETCIEKENIIYLKDAVCNEDFIDKFDFVIYYLGLNTRELNTQYSFILPDYTNPSIMQVKSLDEELIGDSYFILRDKVCNKVTEKNIIHEFGINEDQMIGYLPLEYKDEVAYLNFGYCGRQRIKETSQDMQYAIMSALAIITGDDIKVIKKYYRKAKRNKRL